MERTEFDELDREEWRELGFYYDRNDETRTWNLYGDRLGLSNMCKIIEEYISSKENERLSEHDHLGPYQYFKIVTWDQPMVTEQGIFGSLVNLTGFGELFKSKLENSSMNEQFTIDAEYSTVDSYKILVHVMPDGFDPASLDDATWQ